MIKNIVFDNGGVIVKYSAKTYLNYFKFKKAKKQELDKLFTSSRGGRVCKRRNYKWTI